MGLNKSVNRDLAQMKSPRLLGWGAMVAAFIVSYLFWIIGKQLWWPTVVITCITLASICV